MNKLKAGLLVVILSVFAMSCDKETIITQQNVPTEIDNFVKLHFPNNKILQTIEDKDGLTKSYDVVLEGNVKLEFNRKKEIKSIDADFKLPDSVIPEKIRQYVASNYPNQFISEWELDGKNQQVGLNNDLDLLFNMSGDFIRIDN